MVKKLIFLIIVMGLILFIYKAWFIPSPLSSGDWQYRFSESVIGQPIFPYAWDPHFSHKLGSNSIFLLPLNSYFTISAALGHNFLGMNWAVYERIFWFFPFLVLCVCSPYLFLKKILRLSSSFSIIGSLIYVANSYSLLIASGGQMGVGMAYSIFPFVALAYILLGEKIVAQTKFYEKDTFIQSLYSGVLYSVLLFFDLRIAYVFLVFLVLYITCLILLNYRKLISYIFFYGVITSTLVLVLHAFWLIPFIVVSENPLESLGGIYTSTDAVRFFSFAFFEKTISLLHPNWPENLFGKSTFMQPEFLLIPILGFSTFFINTKKYKLLGIFFLLVVLIGAFLAKGANDPFGGVYILLFSVIPGFQMFRDPSKWYILIAFSYAVLIPFFLFEVSNRIKRRGDVFSGLIILLFIVFWGFTIRDTLGNRLHGTFMSHEIPEDYVRLKNLLSSDKTYYRTLWLPDTSVYSYYDFNHPRVSFSTWQNVSSPSGVFTMLESMESVLKEASVKYIIIPIDSQGKIFITDRKYDSDLRLEFSTRSARLRFVTPVQGFSQLLVYKLEDYKPHFFIANKDGSRSNKVNVKMISPAKYEVLFENSSSPSKLVFSETFNKNWKLKLGKNILEIDSENYNKQFNSFPIPKGEYKGEVIFKPQIYVDIGVYVSLLSSVAIFILIVYLKKK